MKSDYHFLAKQSENFHSRFEILEAPGLQKLVYLGKISIDKTVESEYSLVITKNNRPKEFSFCIYANFVNISVTRLRQACEIQCVAKV